MDEEVKELKKSYVLVYPICFLCQSDGKHPHCKQLSNMAKRRKTSGSCNILNGFSDHVIIIFMISKNDFSEHNIMIFMTPPPPPPPFFLPATLVKFWVGLSKKHVINLVWLNNAMHRNVHVELGFILRVIGNSFP